MIYLSCSNETSGKKDEVDTTPASTLQQPKTVKDIEGRLYKTDSIQVIYYDDPDGDSLRYSRYFTYAEIPDTVKVNALLKELNQVFIQQTVTRSCRSEGKMFMFNGNDVLKTIYFSIRGDSCNYFYFIKDGNFIYFPVTEAAGKWLKDAKKGARKPLNNS